MIRAEWESGIQAQGDQRVGSKVTVGGWFSGNGSVEQEQICEGENE